MNTPATAENSTAGTRNVRIRALTAVVEFVESKHTPRNTLLRAVRTGAPMDAARATEYVELISEWGLQPALQARLAGEVDAALAAAT